MKLKPKYGHINVVKATCFGLGNGFVTFLDNKRDVKGTYSAFRVLKGFRGKFKNFCSVVPQPRQYFEANPSQPRIILPLGWYTRSHAK